MSELTIGRLAQQAGVSVETVRFYQRRGLVQEPDKPVEGYRHYPSETIPRIRFIKRAQTLGFTLREIASLLGLNAISNCSEARNFAARKVAVIDRKIADLTAMRDILMKLVEQCDKAAQAKDDCPVIDALIHD